MLTDNLFKTIIVIALIGTLIVLAKPIVMPIIFSAFLAFFCYPLVVKLENFGIPYGLSIFITVIGITLILTLIVTLFTVEGIRIAKSLPEVNPDGKIEMAFTNPEETIENDSSSQLLNDYQNEIENSIEKIQNSIIAFIPKMLNGIKNMMVFLASVPVYLFFILLSRRQLRAFYYNSFDDQYKGVANRILTQIQSVLNDFLKGMGVVMLIIGSLTTIGLYLLGIEHALFFGLLAGFLTLIPYLGVIISASLPAVTALITYDTYWYALGVIGIFAAVQWVEGNIITPKVMSGQVGLNPLAVIIGIVIFGSLGGLLGVLITTPTLAIIKTVAFYVPGWKPMRKFLKT